MPDEVRAPRPASPAGGPRRSMARRALNGVFEGMLGLLALTMVLAALGPIAGWWHYEVVESGSMVPDLPVGSVAIVRPESLAAVQVGQILAFHPPHMKSYVRIHRVIALDRRNGQVWIRTKGDANNTADPGPVRLKGDLAYHEVFEVPFVGYGAVYLYRHSTRTGLEVALFLVVVAGGMYLIWARDDETPESDRSEDEGEGGHMGGADGVGPTVPVTLAERAAPEVDHETKDLPLPATEPSGAPPARRPAPRRVPDLGAPESTPDLTLTGPGEDRAGKAAGTAKASLLALNNIYTSADVPQPASGNERDQGPRSGSAGA